MDGAQTSAPPPDASADVELEDGSEVVFKVVAAVSTAVVLLLAWSLRMHWQSKQPRRNNYEKLDTSPGQADMDHMEKVLKACSSVGPERLERELLRGIASAPVLEQAAKLRKLEDRELRHLRREVAACAPGWQESESMGLSAAERQNLLLVYHQLYQQKLDTVRLSNEQLQMCDDVSSLVGQLLLSSFEAAVKRQMLSASLTLGRLIACFRLGLWSWEDPECVQLMRGELSSQGTPYPRISLSAAVKSWMDAPCLAPSCTIELVVTVHRGHAGASGAAYQRMGWRGHEAVPIMESYTCLVSREVDGEGGAKGSMLGRLEVEVEQLTQDSATGTLKMFAPKQPGEYELRVSCLSLVVLGVTAETVCRFVVVPHDHPALQHNEPSDDSDYD